MAALRGDPALGVGTRGEFVRGGAGGVAGGEQALHGAHILVAPEVVGGREVFGTAHPGAGGAGVRTDEVRLGGGDLRGPLLGLHVGGGPQDGLRDGHVEEVFPGLGLEFLDFRLVSLRVVLVLVGDLLEGFFGPHVDRAFAFHDVEHAEVVAEVGRDRLHQTVGLPVLELVSALDHVLATEGVGRAGLEEQEPGADRTVGILEADRE